VISTFKFLLLAISQFEALYVVNTSLYSVMNYDVGNEMSPPTASHCMLMSMTHLP